MSTQLSFQAQIEVRRLLAAAGPTIREFITQAHAKQFAEFVQAKLDAQARVNPTIARLLPTALRDHMTAKAFHDGWGRIPGHGMEFRLVDFKAANWKKPWLAENRAGKIYKLSDVQAKAAFELKGLSPQVQNPGQRSAAQRPIREHPTPNAGTYNGEF